MIPIAGYLYLQATKRIGSIPQADSLCFEGSKIRGSKALLVDLNGCANQPCRRASKSPNMAGDGQIDWPLLPDSNYATLGNDSMLIGSTDSRGFLKFPIAKSSFGETCKTIFSGLNVDYTTGSNCDNWINTDNFLLGVSSSCETGSNSFLFSKVSTCGEIFSGEASFLCVAPAGNKPLTVRIEQDPPVVPTYEGGSPVTVSPPKFEPSYWPYYSGTPNSNNPYPPIDWTLALGPVRDQGSCRACWAFAVAAVVEARFYINNKPRAIYHLSEQQLLDCVDEKSSVLGVKAINNCEQGFPNFGLKHVSSFGLQLIQDYPYSGVQTKCRMDPDDAIMTAGKAVSYKYCTNNPNYGEVMKPCTWDSWNEMLSKGPIAVMIDATSVSFQNYRSGIWIPTLEDCGDRVNVLFC